MTSTRPTGVTVFAILAALSGAFAVLGGLALLGIGAFGAAMGGPLLAYFGTFAGIIILALGAVTSTLPGVLGTSRPGPGHCSSC